jgi:non-heme chloroperoxidase
LGDDVSAVLDSLKLSRPVLIGHSFAGEELSSVATRHPEEVAGLVYLDAGYSYAYYNALRGDFFDEPRYFVDMAELRTKLSRLLEGNEGNNRRLLEELLDTDLPQFENDLRERQKELDLESRSSGTPPKVPASPPAQASSGRLNPGMLAMAGMRRYTGIRVPVLAIYAVPLALESIKDPVVRTMVEAREATREERVKAFQEGVPQAHVIRLPNASHDVFRSNEADVLREVRTFIGNLP